MNLKFKKILFKNGMQHQGLSSIESPWQHYEKKEGQSINRRQPLEQITHKFVTKRETLYKDNTKIK